MQDLLNKEASREYSDLSSAKRALLARRLQGEATSLVNQALISKCSRVEPLPLSYAQERLWFLDQLEGGGSGVYNIGVGMRLSGRLRIEVLEESLNEIVNRHEVLRTSYGSKEGRAQQAVGVVERIGLRVVDLSGLGEEEAEEKAKEGRREEGRRGFDLRKGPVMRGRLVKVREEEHELVVVMHHIASDGWSMSVVAKELKHLYEKYGEGEASELKELEIQYVDYAVWQREYLQGEVLEELRGYWKEELGGELGVMELPYDRVRAVEQSYRGGVERFRIEEEVTREIRRQSRREDVTMFMSLAAGLGVVLYRYSGQEDVLLGTPVANRNRGELEEMIGFFVNTVVMRMRVEGESRYEELLREVREVALGAYSHQEMPFEKVVEEIEPERSLSRSPVFQVMMVMQNMPREEMKLGELEVRGLGIESGTAKFDVSVYMWEEGEQIGGMVEYSSELFEKETIKRMIGHYKNVLKGGAEEGKQRISEMRVLSEWEEHQVIEELNDRGKEKEGYRSVVEMIEEQVRERGEAIAVMKGREQVSYGELNRRSNQLGNYLVWRGVGEEEVVGIWMSRRIEMVIGMLGVMKAGGAYLPMEVGYPVKRLREMVEESGARVVLSDRECKEEEMGEEVEVIGVDEEWEEIGIMSEEKPGRELSGENLAYVICTSGSTGKPKAVGVPLSGLENLVSWHQGRYEVGVG